MIIFLVELQKMSHHLMDDDPHCPISLLTPSLGCAGECCLHWAPATCCMSSSQTPGQSRGGRRISAAALHPDTWQWTFWCRMDVVSPKYSTFWFRCCPSSAHEILLVSVCRSFFIWQNESWDMHGSESKQTKQWDWDNHEICPKLSSYIAHCNAGEICEKKKIISEIYHYKVGKCLFGYLLI